MGRNRRPPPRGVDAVVITITAVRGSVPGLVGAKAVVTAGGLVSGNLGGGKVEAKAIGQAVEFLTDQAPCLTLTWNLQRDVLGLGKRTAQSPEMRLVYVRGVDGMILILATNLNRDQLSAADVALLYKRRWEIEYYFRWMKCIMGCGHWMAESRKGAIIQIDLALIGSLLLQLQLGRRPSKRIWEIMQWHQCCMVSDAELKTILAQQLASEQRQRESKTREAFWKRR